MNGNNYQTGYLRVSVYDRTVGRPLENVRVAVSLHNENGQPFEELLTDVAGNTQTLDLEAPYEEYSLFPESNVRPYSLYDLTVIREGYIGTVIRGVQIFAKTVALQNVYLDKGEQGLFDETINISPHNLWDPSVPKIEEEVVKPLPDGEGLVVLPEPVIPEFIIVHAGLPDDDSAPDYTVTFTDYIKNVACSEIYSTWPRATIEANVLAIISFTLNRVYTEWYRSRGKNFTITNSTAYDQAFVYGRNFFTEISDVVDEIFTTYITKPGIRQPLFAQYCNGNYVSCPGWLSQWGSKALGEQGYDAVEILRTYYGSDIYLAIADKVNGIPVSYPGTPLETGSVGEDVRTVQSQLNVISDNYPLIGKLAVDGIFGPLTRNAVLTFQGIFGLEQSGIVDFATWYKISQVYVAVARLT